MKRLMILAMVLALMFTGCCSYTALDGTVTKSFPNCFKTAADKVCNAPQSVLNIADVVINLLKPEVAILVPGSAALLAYVTAQNIKSTGCATLTSLNNLIAFIEGFNTAQVKAMAGKKAVPVGINVQPLQDWAAGK